MFRWRIWDEYSTLTCWLVGYWCHRNTDNYCVQTYRTAYETAKHSCVYSKCCFNTAVLDENFSMTFYQLPLQLVLKTTTCDERNSWNKFKLIFLCQHHFANLRDNVVFEAGVNWRMEIHFANLKDNTTMSCLSMNNVARNVAQLFSFKMLLCYCSLGTVISFNCFGTAVLDEWQAEKIIWTCSRNFFHHTRTSYWL